MRLFNCSKKHTNLFKWFLKIFVSPNIILTWKCFKRTADPYLKWSRISFFILTNPDSGSGYGHFLIFCNTEYRNQYFSARVSDPDPDSGVFWIQIRNPDPGYRTWNRFFLGPRSTLWRPRFSASGIYSTGICWYSIHVQPLNGHPSKCMAQAV